MSILMSGMWPDPLPFIYGAAGILLLMTLLSLLFGSKLGKGGKKTFFLLITIPVLLATLYLGVYTVHKNMISETGGPVHWHADYQIWVCDERLDLIDPSGLKNKIGSALFHEHNDDRIHVEGTLHKKNEVVVGKYFAVVGGELTKELLAYPTEDQGMVRVQNGDLCGSEPGKLKVYSNGRLLEDPVNHLYYPSPLVPPGDCIIVEFSPGDAQTTDRICESWKAAQWDYQNWEELRDGS